MRDLALDSQRAILGNNLAREFDFAQRQVLRLLDADIDQVDPDLFEFGQAAFEALHGRARPDALAEIGKNVILCAAVRWN